MGYGTIILEGVLGLFLLLAGCLAVRTIMLESPRTLPPIKNEHNDAQLREQHEIGDPNELIAADLKKLEMSGVTSREIAALLHLKKWYQAGEGDRAVLLSRWEFIKQLVLDGKLEV